MTGSYPNVATFGTPQLRPGDRVRDVKRRVGIVRSCNHQPWPYHVEWDDLSFGVHARDELTAVPSTSEEPQQ